MEEKRLKLFQSECNIDISFITFKVNLMFPFSVRALLGEPFITCSSNTRR